jgi:predicted NBD/HSP70 family sugar kinase
VADLVGSLCSFGLVRESPSAARGGAGRPSHIVSLDTERVWALAVELGTDAVTLARVGLGGQVGQRISVPQDWRAPLAPTSAVATIARLAQELTGQTPVSAQLVGAAVAVPGTVRRSDGFVHLAPNLRWHDVPFGELLSAHMPWLPGVQVANEADLGALAECAHGAGVGCQHVIYISDNTGVGAGIVVEGALLAGRSGYAGEVGHMKVNPHGRRCRCGGSGCWETEIGAAAVMRRAGRHAADVRAALASVLSDAEAGEPTARRAVHETGQWIARGAANLINIFNPDVLVFGGELRGVFQASEAVVMEQLARLALPQAGAEASVVVAGLGTDSVLVGAAELAFSAFLADPAAVTSGLDGDRAPGRR